MARKTTQKAASPKKKGSGLKIFTFWRDMDPVVRRRWIQVAGLLLAAFTVFTLLATVSYPFTWKADQSLLGDKVKRIYSDVEQEVKSRDKAPGSVRATYCADKESERATVLASIDNARKRGAKWSDIAILVRGNKTGSDLASLLVSNNIPVVSDDSLLVSSCLAVRKLVSLLSLILDPDLKIGQYMTKEMGITLPSSWYSLVDLSEDLLRKMRKSDPSAFLVPGFHSSGNRLQTGHYRHCTQ